MSENRPKLSVCDVVSTCMHENMKRLKVSLYGLLHLECHLIRISALNLLGRFSTERGEKDREVGGWGRLPFSRNLMSPTPRRKWYLTTGRRFH